MSTRTKIMCEKFEKFVFVSPYSKRIVFFSEIFFYTPFTKVAPQQFTLCNVQGKAGTKGMHNTSYNLGSGKAEYN